MPTVFVQAPFFINPMTKTPKNFYNKYHYKKMRPFAERTGDWICRNCRNLNFSFRTECNRCKLPKKETMDVRKNNVYKANNEYKSNDLENPPNLNVYNGNNSSFNPYSNSYQNKNKCKYKNYNQNINLNKNNNKNYLNNNEDN